MSSILKNETRPDTVNRLPVLIATCFASMFGALLFNTMPIVLGIIAAHASLHATELGWLGAAAMAGSFVAVSSALFWVTRLNWKLVMCTCAMGAMFSVQCIQYTTSLIALAAILASLGAFQGAIFATTLSALAQSAAQSRVFALSVIFQVSFAALSVFVLQVFLAPKFGISSIAWVFTLYAVVLILSYPCLPKRQATTKRTQSDPAPFQSANNLALLGLLGMGVLYLGLLGVWEFLERIGDSAGLTAAFVGSVISTALVIGASGAVAAAMFGERFGNIIPMAVGIAMLVAAMAVLSISTAAWSFAAAVLLFNGGWNLALPYQYTLISRVDRTDKLIAIAPAVQTLGAALSSAAAAIVVGVFSFFGLFMFMSVCAIISFLLFAYIVRRHQNDF